MRTWAEREGVQAHFIHSGGHAWPEDLDRLEAALHPRRSKSCIRLDDQVAMARLIAKVEELVRLQR